MSPSKAKAIVRALLWAAWLTAMTGLLYAAFVVGQLSEAARFGVS